LAHLEHTANIARIVPPIGIGDGPLVSVYDPAVPALSVYAQALIMAGRAEHCAAAIEAALARARTIDMPWYLGWALSGACSAGVLRRDFGEVRTRAEQLRAHCGDGQAHLQAVARFMLGWAAIVETDDRGLIALLREALEEVMSVADPLVTSRYFSMLADAHLKVRQPDEALAALERAWAERGESRFYDAELQRQRAAIVLARTGRRQAPRPAVQEAEAALESAIEIAVKQGAHLLALRATTDLCRLWRTSHRADAARDRLKQAIAVFAASYQDIDLREARELLASPS
jgi:hypothetical protein